MPQSSLTADERSRKNHSAILRGLASVGQVRVAEGIGKSETTVSHWKDKDAAVVAKMLAVMGLKVVPESMRCFDQQQIGAILTLAKQHMAQIENTDQLSWEE